MTPGRSERNFTATSTAAASFSDATAGVWVGLQIVHGHDAPGDVVVVVELVVGLGVEVIAVVEEEVVDGAVGVGVVVFEVVVVVGGGVVVVEGEVVVGAVVVVVVEEDVVVGALVVVVEEDVVVGAVVVVVVEAVPPVEKDQVTFAG